jgi:cell division septum initiation protein DivIVA
MSKSRKQAYEERVRKDESEAHQTRRAINRQLDELCERGLDEIQDEWDYDDIDRFEKIKRNSVRIQ